MFLPHPYCLPSYIHSTFVRFFSLAFIFFGESAGGSFSIFSFFFISSSTFYLNSFPDAFSPLSTVFLLHMWFSSTTFTFNLSSSLIVYILLSFSLGSLNSKSTLSYLLSLFPIPFFFFFTVYFHFLFKFLLPTIVDLLFGPTSNSSLNLFLQSLYLSLVFLWLLSVSLVDFHFIFKFSFYLPSLFHPVSFMMTTFRFSSQLSLCLLLLWSHLLLKFTLFYSSLCHSFSLFLKPDFLCFYIFLYLWSYLVSLSLQLHIFTFYLPPIFTWAFNLISAPIPNFLSCKSVLL